MTLFSNQAPMIPPESAPVTPLQSGRRSSAGVWIVWILIVGAIIGGGVLTALHFQKQQLAEQARANANSLVTSAERLLKAGRHAEAEKAAREAVQWLPTDARCREILSRISKEHAKIQEATLTAAKDMMAGAEATVKVDIEIARQAYTRISKESSFPPDLRKLADERLATLNGAPCSLRLPDDWPQYTTLAIDGTPCRPEGNLITGIQAGRHRITIVRHGYRDPAPIELDFRGTDPLLLPEIKWTLPGTTVKVTSDPPGADIWKNGKSTGKTTPGTFEDVDDGRIEFLLKLPGRADTAVSGEVRERRPTELSATLPELPKLPVSGIKPGERREFNLTPRLRVPFRWIPAGTFKMGGPGVNEQPVREVKLSRGFWMAETEFTQSQWEESTSDLIAIVLSAASDERIKPAAGPHHPIVKVSWEKICGNRSRQGGVLGKINDYFRKNQSKWLADLPTEAQWEYACRAGTTGLFADKYSAIPAAFDRMATHAGNSGGSAAAVGKRSPNPWGLHDMHGNVHEWCRDWYQDTYLKLSLTDPAGPASAWKRVIRGGSFLSPSRQCLSSSRASAYESSGSALVGFRLVLYPLDAAIPTPSAPVPVAKSKPPSKPKAQPKPKPKAKPKAKPKPGKRK